MTDAWKGVRGYAGPSDPRRSKKSPFWGRFFWQVYVSRVEPHIKGGRRKWVNVNRAEKRKFEISYGYNPRCCQQGSWGKPGTFHWRRNRD